MLIINISVALLFSFKLYIICKEDLVYDPIFFFFCRQLSMMMQQFSSKEKGLRALEEHKWQLVAGLQEQQRAHEEKVKCIMGIYSEIVAVVSS